DLWYILSAEHGLLDPGTLTAPYDTTLATLPAAERAAWTTRTRRQLAAALDLHAAPADAYELIVLAGARYRAPLAGLTAHAAIAAAHTPLAGLGIGQQKAHLKQALATTTKPEPEPNQETTTMPEPTTIKATGKKGRTQLLAVGESITHERRSHGTYTFLRTADGYWLWSERHARLTGPHKAASAPAKELWAWSQGHDSAAAYKAATGAPIPGVGGRAFYGLDKTGPDTLCPAYVARIAAHAPTAHAELLRAAVPSEEAARAHAQAQYVARVVACPAASAEVMRRAEPEPAPELLDLAPLWRGLADAAQLAARGPSPAAAFAMPPTWHETPPPPAPPPPRVDLRDLGHELTRAASEAVRCLCAGLLGLLALPLPAPVVVPPAPPPARLRRRKPTGGPQLSLF
ncbi:MAG TPA: hypothetical protein VFH61_08435, partial [Thermoleophilia bacterium]|nr:hypothetical protein [Thermoleophilia bacterium]